MSVMIVMLTNYKHINGLPHVVLEAGGIIGMKLYYIRSMGLPCIQV